MGARTYRVNRIVLINLMYLTIGLLFAASGMLPPTAFALFAALSLIEGVTSSVFNSSFVSVIQSRIDAGVLGRVMSLYYSFGLLPSAIGLLGTGFLAEPCRPDDDLRHRRHGHLRHRTRRILHPFGHAARPAIFLTTEIQGDKKKSEADKPRSFSFG